MWEESKGLIWFVSEFFRYFKTEIMTLSYLDSLKVICLGHKGVEIIQMRKWHLLNNATYQTSGNKLQNSTTIFM